MRRNVPKEKRICKIFYAASKKNWTQWQKYKWLEQIDRTSGTPWDQLLPDARNRWFSEGIAQDFNQLLSLENIFEQQSRGIATSRDTWAYNFDEDSLVVNIKRTISFYNEEVSRWIGHGDREIEVDRFVRYDDGVISWSRDLKQDLLRERRAGFSTSKVRKSLYRPFTTLSVFFDRVFNEEVYVFPSFVPTEQSEAENKLICLTGKSLS